MEGTKPKTILRKGVNPVGTHLNTHELAARWKMCPGSLANWRREGKGPKFLKLGAKVLYPLTEVEAWEMSNLKTGTNGV